MTHRLHLQVEERIIEGKSRRKKERDWIEEGVDKLRMVARTVSI
jgi:hypothetical protein